MAEPSVDAFFDVSAGERTVPGIWHENYWFRRHEACYLLVVALVAGLARAAWPRRPRVLDAGSGEGFGAGLLRDAGADVLALDYDAAAMSHLWLRQISPNLADYATCAEVAMNYAPIWESSHRNWLVVKVGCPTKIVDADGKTIGWHMPECQGTLPGTTYPLRCRFDPSEI